MKRPLLLILLLLFFEVILAQNKINQSLKIELDSIMKSDQILREYLDSETTEIRKKEILKEIGRQDDNDFKNNIWMYMNAQDSVNMKKVEKIILDYGYPGKSLVGEPTNESAWYVIQHSKKYLNICL
jgi:hypothetical protein